VFQQNCETNGRNVSVTKTSQQKMTEGNVSVKKRKQ